MYMFVNLTLVKEVLRGTRHYMRVKSPISRKSSGKGGARIILTDIMQSMGNCLQGVSQGLNLSYGLAASLFVAGLVSGFTHCMAMCGPFVISQTGKVEKLRDAALLPYHFGRLTTYTIMAALLYSVLNLVFLFMPIRSFIIAPILLTAALIFLINAFPQIAKYFSWATSFKISLPYRYVSGLFGQLSHNPTMIKKFMMGLILGFMPCGMVTSALMASATAPDVMGAAFAMMAFGAGTIPALMVTGFAGKALQLKYPMVMPRLTKAMMVWSSAWLIIMAGIILT